MRDDLDRLIDGALAEYANPEPLAGLETRIIGRASRRRWPRWAALIPVAAVILVMLVGRPKPTPAPPPPPAVVASVAPAPAPVLLPQTTVPKRVARHRRPAVTVPKRDTFPTLRPLNDEERLLVQLAQSHPEGLLASRPDVIEIKPIEIAPLDIDGSK